MNLHITPQTRGIILSSAFFWILENKVDMDSKRVILFATKLVIVVTFLGAGVAGIHAETDSVSPENTATTLVVQQNDSIQASINSANPGDSIVIENGTFSEAIVVNESVSLVGSGETVLDGDGIASDGITITANNVSLTRLDVTMFVDGIHTNSENTTIHNVVVDQSAAHGIYGENASDLSITQTVAADNGEKGVSVSGSTVSLENVSSWENGDGGITLSGTDISLRNVTTDNNDRTTFGDGHGIKITANGTAELQDIVARQNTRQGIIVAGNTPTVTATGILSSANGETGITVDADVLTLRQATTESNEKTDFGDGHGIDVRVATELTLEEITTTQNAGTGLLLDAGTQIDVNDSYAADNAEKGYRLTGPSITIANSTAPSNDDGGISATGENVTLNTVTAANNERTTNSGGHGIAISVTDTLSLDTVVAGQNAGMGLLLDAASRIDAVGIQATDNAENGLTLDAPRVTISESTASSNGGGGISATGDSVSLATVTAANNDNTLLGDSHGIDISVTDTVILRDITAGQNGGMGLLSDAGTRIDGDHIQASGNGDKGLKLTAPRINISDSTANANADGGINATAATVSMASVTAGNNDNALLGDGYGINITADITVELHDLVTRDNAREGIIVGGTQPDVSITGAVSTGNGETGIAIEGRNVTIIHANASQNDAIPFGDGHGMDIFSTTVVSIQGSFANQNQGSGVIVDANKLDSRYLDAEDNDETGVITQGLEFESYIQYSSLVGNQDYQIENRNDNYGVNATNNWWGSATGADGSDTSGPVLASYALANKVDTRTMVAPTYIFEGEGGALNISATGLITGVSWFEIVLDRGNTSLTNLLNVSSTDNPALFDVATENGNKTVRVTANFGASPLSSDTTGVTLALERLLDGTTDVSVEQGHIRDPAGYYYQPADEGSSFISVWSAPATVDGDPPRDIDGDHRYEDIDGDRSFDIFDVQLLFATLGSETLAADAGAFNFDQRNPGAVTIFDVQALFQELVR